MPVSDLVSAPEPEAEAVIQKHHPWNPSQLECPSVTKNKLHSSYAVDPPHRNVGHGDAMFVHLVFRGRILILKPYSRSKVPVED